MTFSQSPTARKTKNPSADNCSDVVAPGNVEKRLCEAAQLLLVHLSSEDRGQADVS
jgi:hypothetical protein